MLKNKKILIILSIIVFLFINITTSFASGYDYNYSNNIIDTNKDYDYKYKPVNSTNIDNKNFSLTDYVPELEADSRVSSGDYYYFIVYNYINSKSVTIYLVKKSAMMSSVNLVFNNWNCNTETSGYKMNHFGLTISNSKLTGDDFIVYSGNAIYYEKLKAIPTATYGIILSGIKKNDENVFYIPVVTNYDKDVKMNFYNGSSTVFYQAPTRLGGIVQRAEPTAIMTEVLNILPMILVVMVSYLGLRKALSMLSMLLHQS